MSGLLRRPDVALGNVRPGPRDFVAPVAAGALVAALSAYQLGARSLWRDEIASVFFASSPLSRLAHFLTTSEANQAVYYLLLRVWLKGGDDEAWIRLLSLLFGVATVIPVYLVGRRVAGSLAGGLAAFFFAASPFVILYDQEARGYTLAMFVAATLTWLLLRALDRPTMPRWAAYGLLAAIGLYVHFFVAFVVLAHVLFLVATHSWPHGRALAAAGIPILLAGVPLPVIIALQSRVIDWIPPITIESTLGTLASVAGGQALLLVIASLTGLTVATQARQRLVWLVLASLLVPPAMAILISLVKPVLVERYLAVSVPAMTVVAGIALAGIRVRGAMVAGVIAVGLLLAASLSSVYQRSGGEDWRSAAGWIADASSPGDRIVFQTTLSYRELSYYLHRLDVTDLPDAVDVAGAEADARGPVWVLLRGADRVEADRMREGFKQRYMLIEERAVGGGARIRLALFRPSG